MRLLNTRTLELHEFHSDIPRYAILSHTWEDGEVTFEEIGNPDAQRKAGYQKIKRCCVQAASDDFQFVWIDTCCINKQSSAELSESINSMFRWYKNAEVCYAYLADVTGAEDPNRSESDFVKSRWFTRGWTLQELVAPSKIIFFGGIDWVKIGTKVSLQNALSRITKIDISVLEFSQNMFNASVAQRMSWASKRHTTRTEDIAYCLLGIFNINMPLLYGEGDKAFIRLQLELLNASNEQTIFAWSMPEYNEVFETGTPVSGQYTRVDVSSLGGLGLLAPSPAPFVECGNVRRYRKTTTPSHQMTNIGLSITLPTFRVPKLRMRGLHLASLDCYRENTRDWHTTPICIYLRHNGNSKFSRVALSESLLNDERWIWARKTPMFVTSERYFGHGLQKTGSSSGDMSIGTLFQDELAAGNDTTALLGDRHERHHRVCFQRLLEGIRFWMGWCIFALRNIKVVLFNSYVNVFVLLVPLGIAAGAMHWDPTAVFVLNCLAIVGLDSMLNFTMSDLWMILGQPPGDSADVVQFIFSIVALKMGEILIVQSSILGSILSNILFVLGYCFLISGISHNEQSFDSTATSTMSTLMAVALASLIIPATLCATLQSTELEAGTHILRLSRGTAIILIIIYFVYVYLQLRSHTYLFDIEQNESIEAEEDELDLQIGPVAAVTISILLAIGIGVCAVYLIDSIKSITKTQETSKKFIGFVVLPWVGRTKLLPFAILTVHRNNTGPVIDAAIKNSVHIAFFITPFTVIFGWVIGQDMTLHFQNYDIIVFFLCVMLVNYLVRDGKNRYLVSAICIGIYVIIVLAYWY